MHGDTSPRQKRSASDLLYGEHDFSQQRGVEAARDPDAWGLIQNDLDRRCERGLDVHGKEVGCFRRGPLGQLLPPDRTGRLRALLVRPPRIPGPPFQLASPPGELMIHQSFLLAELPDRQTTGRKMAFTGQVRQKSASPDYSERLKQKCLRERLRC